MITVANKSQISGVKQLIEINRDGKSVAGNENIFYLKNGEVTMTFHNGTKTFKMNESFIGDGTDLILDDEVIEFTVKIVENNFLLIIRNQQGIAREIAINFISYRTYTSIYGEPQFDVVKVINGRMFKTQNYYVSNQQAKALLDGDAYEVFEDGSSSKLIEDDKNIVKKFGGYKINKNGDLLSGANVILSGISDITKYKDVSDSMVWGAKNHANVSSAKQLILTNGMSNGFANGYENWDNSKASVSCGWAGVGTAISYVSPTFLNQCVRKLQKDDKQNIDNGIIAISADGNYKLLNGDIAIDVPTVGDTTEAFSIINFINYSTFNLNVNKKRFAQNEGIATTMLFKK